MDRKDLAGFERVSLFKLGRSACGKGYTEERLREVLRKKRVEATPLSGGGLTRNRLISDEKFRQDYEEKVKGGYYIPDFEMIPMIQGRVNEIIKSRGTFVEGDGVGRTLIQMQYLTMRGFVNNDSSICVLMIASEKTCRQRFLEAQERRRQEGRTDTDISVFDNREKQFKECTPPVIELIYNGDYPTVIIDAESGLDEASAVYNEIALDLQKNKRVSAGVQSSPVWLDRRKISLAQLQEMFI